jgi:glucose-6-phosphate isomerase
MIVSDIFKNLSEAPSFVMTAKGFTLDVSGMDLSEEAIAALLDGGDDSRLARAHRGLQAIEAGAIKNPDENRQVTHFSDRLSYPESAEFREVEAFAEEVRLNPDVDAVIINGIGGSALGPQLLQFALNGPYWNELSVDARRGYPRIYFIDNTDTAGLADAKLVVDLAEAIVVTISKSGSTQETKNNMIALEQAYAAQGLEFARHAVAITMAGSQLDQHARSNDWSKVLPMAESIGGRTSETNIVGHVPAALTGIDFRAFVGGARAMDEVTRNPELSANPAYQLAAAWYIAGNGRGDRNMVVVPYSDRLVLLAKYLQQLVMESLGKELDLDGNVVHQGLTVYGNKGGTDAHAYIQQLNDGRDDFFITFIEPLLDAEQVEVGDGLTMGDYLHGFKEGLTNALRGKGRKVIDIVIDQLDAESLGMLVALYERAVAVYAELININAFHQPGVQAYKLASKEVNAVNLKLQEWLRGRAEATPFSGTAAEVAEVSGLAENAVTVGGLLAKFAVNKRTFAGRGVKREFVDGAWRYTV